MPRLGWDRLPGDSEKSAGDFLDICARIEGADAEVAFAGGAEAAAGGADDVRFS